MPNEPTASSKRFEQSHHIAETQQPPLDQLVAEFDAARGLDVLSNTAIDAMSKDLMAHFQDAWNHERKQRVDRRLERLYTTTEGRLLQNTLEKLQNETGNTGSFRSLRQAMRLIKPLDFADKLRRFIDGDLEAAEFNIVTGDIKLYRSPDEYRPLQLLKEMAQFGFSQAAQSLHHETIHSYQFAPRAYQAIARTYDEARIDQLLRETHSHRGISQASGQYPGTASLMSRIKRYSEEEDHDVRDKIIEADFIIKRLYALDFTDEMIGAIIQRARWDEQTKTYPDLAMALDEARVTRHLSEDDVENLLLAKTLQQKTFLLKARHAAQTTLAQAHQELLNQK